jgi:hypothetical protein
MNIMVQHCRVKSRWFALSLAMNVELTINAGQATDKMKNEVLKYKESRQQLSHYCHQLEFVPKNRFCMNSRRNIAWHLRTAKKLLEWTMA